MSKKLWIFNVILEWIDNSTASLKLAINFYSCLRKLREFTRTIENDSLS